MEKAFQVPSSFFGNVRLFEKIFIYKKVLALVFLRFWFTKWLGMSPLTDNPWEHDLKRRGDRTLNEFSWYFQTMWLVYIILFQFLYFRAQTELTFVIHFVTAEPRTRFQAIAISKHQSFNGWHLNKQNTFWKQQSNFPLLVPEISSKEQQAGNGPSRRHI